MSDMTLDRRRGKGKKTLLVGWDMYYCIPSHRTSSTRRLVNTQAGISLLQRPLQSAIIVAIM